MGLSALRISFANSIGNGRTKSIDPVRTLPCMRYWSDGSVPFLFIRIEYACYMWSYILLVHAAIFFSGIQFPDVELVMIREQKHQIGSVSRSKLS